MKESLDISPDDYFKHKLDTIQSPQKKNEDFFTLEKLEKQHLKNNLVVFSKKGGLQFDAGSYISRVKNLNFNHKELTNLSKLNAEFEKGKFTQNPLSLVDKQFNLNKLDKFEFIYKTTEDLKQKHKVSISNTDLKVLYAHTKKTGFTSRVPNIVKSYSNDITKKLIPPSVNVVDYTEQKLNKVQAPIPTNTFFKMLNKMAKTAQQQGPNTKVNKQDQEEEKKKGMQID